PTAGTSAKPQATTAPPAGPITKPQATTAPPAGPITKPQAPTSAPAKPTVPAVQVAAGPPAPLAVARSGHTATALNNGKVLLVGGKGASGSPLASAELYDPATNAITA